MLGFAARALTTALHVDGVELTDARWFTRPELAAAVRAQEVLLPGRASIARSLVEDWFGARLPAACPPPTSWAWKGPGPDDRTGPVSRPRRGGIRRRGAA
jgi:hypothetical protein